MSISVKTNSKTKHTNSSTVSVEFNPVSIDIQLDSKTKTYNAGELITGKVAVTSPITKGIQNIYVEIGGYCSVSWINRYRNKHTRYTSSHFVFKKLINLDGEMYCANPTQENATTMYSGTNNYKFKHTLPQNLPSSFQGDHGKIEYIVEAKVNIPWEKEHTISAKQEFNVVSTVPLENIVKAYSPISIEINEKSLPIRATAKANYSGYTKKETMFFKVSVQNQSKIHVLDVALKLQVDENYTSTKPYTCKKSETSFINEISIGPVDAGTFKNIDAKLVVPETIPSGMNYSPIINWDYFISMVLSLSNGNNLTANCPIFIGTEKIHPKKRDDDFEISSMYY